MVLFLRFGVFFFSLFFKFHTEVSVLNPEWSALAVSLGTRPTHHHRPPSPEDLPKGGARTPTGVSVLVRTLTQGTLVPSSSWKSLSSRGLTAAWSMNRFNVLLGLNT